MAEDEDISMAASQEGEGEEQEQETGKTKQQRKRKRRTMDAHFWGMSDAEIASIKASLAAEAADGSDGGNLKREDATGSGGVMMAEEEQEEEIEEEEVQYEGQLSKEEIQARRRILHTDWRMAAFSQFAHCFPHLCIKEFSIEKLERDLEGTEPGSYVGEVISRLLYHLTKDSSLAGKSPDKPWLIRLRREFLRRDPAHNSLGDGPLYVSGGDFYDDDEEEQATLHSQQVKHDTPQLGQVTPAVDQSAALTHQPPPADTTPVQAPSDNTDGQPKTEEGTKETEITTAENGQAVKEEEDKDEKPAWLAEFPNSRGWEDLSLQEQIYALWAVTEWHLTNADKFRNILVKYRIEPEQPFWRIEPIGYDKDYNVYWMFDDFRLWIERQTPVRRQQLVLLEETAERLKARERARQKRIRHEQRMRMKALHDRRRERIAAKKAAEQALDQEIEAMDEQDRKKAAQRKAAAATNAENTLSAANGKTSGKRKRTAVVEPEEEEEDDQDFAAEEEEEEDEEAEEAQNIRVSSRISRARRADTATTTANTRTRPDRRRSTRNSSAGNLASMQIGNGEEEWQQIPAEWMRSEEEEKDEDPDFGAEQQENGAESDNDSELSLLEGDDDDEDEDGGGVSRKSRRSNRRSSQRQRRTSPRKVRETRSNAAASKSETKGESELSDLSDVEGMSLDEAEDNEEDGEDEKIDLNEPVGYYPDSAWESYKAVPSFDDEDKDQPEGFVHWELLIKDLPEWLEFSEKYFPNTEDPREVSLVSWVDEHVVPKVHAELERREEVRKKEEAARKAAERKARLEKEKAAAAAAGERGTPPVAGAPPPGRTFRSSRIAQKEAKEAEERAKALAEERSRRKDTPDQNMLHSGEEHTTQSQAEVKIAERDRRAARAKEREEAKKAKEEAEMLAALQEAEGGSNEQEASGPAAAGDASFVMQADQSFPYQQTAAPMPSASATPSQAQLSQPPQPQVSQAPLAPADVPILPASVIMASSDQTPVSAEPEYVDDGGAEDYFLDCSVCKKRGLNLDPNSRLVACDNCDRWEHVVCHRKADEKAGRPKRDWDNDPFLCEDCEGLEESVILPSAPKRERSEKQKAGARKGAEKRKAKAAAERAKKAASKPAPKSAKPSTAAGAPGSSASPAPSGSKPATPISAGQPQMQQRMQMAQQQALASHPSPMQQMQPQQPGSSFQQIPPALQSPYHSSATVHSPSMGPYANIPSPSLQPYPQQRPSQSFQPGHFQGQQMQSNMQPRQPGAGMPSTHLLPQQQSQPQYAMQQHAFAGHPQAFQGNFAPQGTYADASGPPPPMYAQQSPQIAYGGAVNPMQQQQQQMQQRGYQASYPNFGHAGSPASAYAQSQQSPQTMAGFTAPPPQQQPQQHQMQQHQQQHLMQGSLGMGQMQPQSHLHPSPGPQ